ncbi:unnamed protein product [Effrenium voratum]|uniref:IPT/TIG domain-containing protein n=1 Tax=Effrenium voratum TaxID=2562239 RepID=A0AA36J6J3_9DINO|nr:unnamed protein product [Effrenium voratum]
MAGLFKLGAKVLPLSVDNIGKLHRVWGGSMDIKTGDLYHFTVYPQVDSIEPSEGGSFGGNNLTLHGTSFAVQPEANEVTVGGKTCTA